MTGRHSILSPSAAHRWLACTPSARFEEQIPDEPSPYAEEGTLAHELAALILSARAGIFRGDQTAFNYTLNAKMDAIRKYYVSQGKDSDEATQLTRQMSDYGEAYATFVLDKGGEVFIEKSYDLSRYVLLAFGTADATSLTKTALHITDYKYGAGVRVAATANKQLMLYGLGAYANLSAEKAATIETVTVSIFQPRAGGASTWEISLTDLLRWAEEEVAPKAALAIAGAGDFVPGDHCQFCKARTRCKAYYDRFADLKNIMDSRVMGTDDLATVLHYGSQVASWVKKVEEETIARMQNGETVPGFKLVAGRGRRSFRNEDAVVEILLGQGFDSYEIFDPKLKALTEVEKLVGPKRFKELFENQIMNVPGKPQIATKEDNRPAIDASAANEYD